MVVKSRETGTDEVLVTKTSSIKIIVQLDLKLKDDNYEHSKNVDDLSCTDKDFLVCQCIKSILMTKAHIPNIELEEQELTHIISKKAEKYYMDSLCKDHFLQRQYRKVDGGVLWSRNERNLDCTVTFQTHSILQRFMLHFDLLQLDCNDHLYVYDGAHATAPPKADLSCRNTKQQVGALFTRSNFVTLKYVTDNWGTDANGFRLVITSVKDPKHGCKEFRCKQREFCVSADLMCDGVDHCADGSDEDTAALCPESGGPGASGAWLAGCAGALSLVATVAAAITFCACRRRAANQRTRLHMQELASSNGGGGCAGGEAGATRLPGNPQPPAGPCGAARAGRLRRAA
ncbi:hypothetical protein PYW08_001334 [Mythimna loreyi]|uniref:Uncharacterized protein n=1 Tax=Mythimna loreyi TaxID=667449 RepID=A0ACC2R0B1_9NEOP|nr:hypothetical protein PYW08_001334 [Mythimna loreyi]